MKRSKLRRGQIPAVSLPLAKSLGRGQRGRSRAASDDLQVVLAIAGSFQQATYQADEKARGVATVYLALSTAAGTQIGRLGEVSGIAAGAVWSGVAIFVLAFLLGGHWLIQANRPRMPLAGPANRFSFPDVAQASPSDRREESQDIFTMTEEARQWSEVLARIAVAKNQNVARAMAAVAVMFLVSLFYLFVIALLG